MTLKSKHGQRWGDWEFNAENLTLVISRPEFQYEVALERCRSSAEVLDWLCQVARKTGATSKDVGDLLKAIDRLAGDLQDVMCSGRAEMMNGRNWAREMLLETS